MPENNITKSFDKILIDLLKTDSRFVDDEGELIKAAVIDHAWKIDHDLVRLLLSKPEIEKKFFDEIEGHWIFNINTFIEYISDKNFLANSYTRFRNKIGLNIGGKFLRERGEVSLVWPYKDCVLEGGQTKEEEKRKEIFFNEILAQDEIDRLFDPKVLTNFKCYTPDGEQKVTEIRRDESGTIKENLIIKGNNLLALHTLKTQFRGKVKLIYIDPPYNTGDDEFGYNDNFNHSSWLTFMKNRLEVAREFLSNEGVFFIQIDYRELAYLKILMDDIFGRNNFIGQINWQRVPEGRTLLGQGESDMKIQTEYLLVYSKNKRPGLLNNNIKKKLDATEKIMKQYSYTLEIKSTPVEHIRFKDSNGGDVILYTVKDYKLKPAQFKSVKDYLKLYNKTVQSVGVQEESTFQQKLILFTKKINTLCVAEYLPTKGKRKGQRVKAYFLGERKLLFAKEYSVLENDRLYRLSDINDFWSNLEIQVTDIANEGGVKLKRGKKPEELLKRIISWSSFSTKDIIMDFFLGSGTTAAIAHKMGRQYIGIEQLEYGKNDSVIRLQNVIGKRKKDSLIEEYKDYDKSGISKSVDWQGGGDFVYCELMKYNEAFMDKIQFAKTSDELLEIWKDIAKNSFLNWYVNPEMPKEAVNNFIEIGRFENGLEKQKKLLAELLNKNQLYVNLSEIDDEDFKVGEEDKKLNQSFYGEAYNG